MISYMFALGTRPARFKKKTGVPILKNIDIPYLG